MPRAKRPWGVYAGPIILIVGLAGFWGVKSGLGMRDMVEGWADRLAHSPEPVTMEMPNVPVIPPLFVNGDRIGRIETVVVERTRPGAVDSIRVVASVAKEHVERLERCALRIRMPDLDLGSYTRALHCTHSTEGLEPFGRLSIEGSDVRVPIYVRAGDLPCTLAELHDGPCGQLTDDLREDLADLAEELREEATRLQEEVQKIKVDVKVGR